MRHRVARLLSFGALVAGIAVPVAAAPTPTDRPRITRAVPQHPDSLLAGCTRDDRRMIFERIARAIEVGAPTYNRGDVRGCYEIYERTARAIEAALPSRCPGPAQALREGRDRAARAPSDDASAWAMRDAFDGLLIVIERVETAR